MTSARRPTPINDDLGDRFPGALPADTSSVAYRPAGAQERIVRMRAADSQQNDPAGQTDREDLAVERAERTFAEESARTTRERRTAGRRGPGRTHAARPPGPATTPLVRMSRFTRSSLDRFDRYTLEVFDPGHPYRPHADQ